MTGPNILNTAIFMFGNETGVSNDAFQYAYNGWGTTAPGGQDIRLGIDCSHLVYEAQLAAGYAIPDLSTKMIYNEGKLAPDGQSYYESVSKQNLKEGDAVLFGTPDEHGQGKHIGIVESYDPKTGKGRFYGSQNSTGPALADFDINGNGSYWGRDPTHRFLTGLRPKAETYDPETAAEKLRPIVETRIQALSALQHKEPAIAGDAQRANKRVLDDLDELAKMQEAAKHQLPVDAAPTQDRNMNPDRQRSPRGQNDGTGFLAPDVQRILDAMHSGDPTRIDAAFRQNMENHFASPQGQAFRLDVEAQAQQMQQGQEQAVRDQPQQDAQQPSGPARGMSR